MSSTFSLHQVLMACMATGILVSILVTSIHAQWQLVPPNATVDSSMSRGTPGGGAGEQVINAYKSRIEQLSLEVEKAKDSAPSSSSTERPAAITPVPSVASSKEVVVAGGAAQAFEDYIALHKKILAKDPSVQQRYIIAHPQAQMNNRLRVIVGGIALGMLTRRAFLIEFSDGYYASLDDCFASPIDLDVKHFEINRIGSRDTMSMDDVDALLCSDYDTRFPGSSIELGTPPNLIPFFYRNSHYTATLQRWFGSEDAIYRAIHQRFLPPSPTVDGMKKKFLQEKMNQPYKLGIHLRWGGDMRPQPIQSDEWEDMLGCVDAVLPRQYRSSSDLGIFVAADTPESREKAQQMLERKYPQAKVLFYEQWLRSNTPGGVQAALTELLLLSECDNLVLTPASSYGETAMSLHGKPGYFVRSTVPNPARIQFSVTHEIAKNCMRPYSIQPTIENFSKDIVRASCYHPDMHGISF